MPFIDGGGVEKNLFQYEFFFQKFRNIIICTYSKKYKRKFNKKVSFLTPKFNNTENINLKFKYLLCLFALFKYLYQNKNVLVFSFQANIYCVLLFKLLNVE